MMRGSGSVRLTSSIDSPWTQMTSGFTVGSGQSRRSTITTVQFNFSEPM